MSKLCPSCFFIGKGKHGFLNGNIFVGIGFVGVGIYGLITKNMIFGSFEAWIGLNVVLIALGIFRIVEYYVGGNICPKCSAKPMLDVSTPKAIKLIKEHNFDTKPPNAETPSPT